MEDEVSQPAIQLPSHHPALGFEEEEHLPFAAGQSLKVSLPFGDDHVCLAEQADELVATVLQDDAGGVGAVVDHLDDFRQPHSLGVLQGGVVEDWPSPHGNGHLLPRKKMTSEERDAVVRRGGELAGLLQRTLGRELLSAIRDGGPAQALEACGRVALNLTREVGRGHDLKRTSLRYRNSANAPDGLEREALELFAAKARGDHPPWYAEKFRREDRVFYRYYQPLYATGLCLTCHGPASDLPAAVRDILNGRYPEDRATGFGDGDFRGLIRVEISAETLHP
jgi:hypothetical protein